MQDKIEMPQERVVYISPPVIRVKYREPDGKDEHGKQKYKYLPGIIVDFVYGSVLYRTGMSEGQTLAIILSEKGDQLMSKSFAEFVVVPPEVS